MDLAHMTHKILTSRGKFMVHKTGRSDRGPCGSLLFWHGTVPYLKQTVNLNGSRVFRFDRTVRSEFNNLDLERMAPVSKWSPATDY